MDSSIQSHLMSLYVKEHIEQATAARAARAARAERHAACACRGSRGSTRRAGGSAPLRRPSGKQPRRT